MRQHCRGFTLIELLIAIVLAAGVTVASTLLARSALEYEGRHSERWALQADIRNSRLLLEYYWPQRTRENFKFDSRYLLFQLNERGKTYLIGFACEDMDSGSGSFAFYRWLATNEEITRIRNGEAWPTSARQNLINYLDQCGFALLQPPPVDDNEASPLWVGRWTRRDSPNVLRFAAASLNGLNTPPIIVSTPAQ